MILIIFDTAESMAEAKQEAFFKDTDKYLLDYVRDGLHYRHWGSIYTKIFWMNGSQLVIDDKDFQRIQSRMRG